MHIDAEQSGYEDCAMCIEVASHYEPKTLDFVFGPWHIHDVTLEFFVFSVFLILLLTFACFVQEIFAESLECGIDKKYDSTWKKRFEIRIKKNVKNSHSQI